jgi:hypothetical protein
MAITTLQGGPTKLRIVKILSPCLGPGGVVLNKGRKVRIPEADAYTLVSGMQAEFAEEDSAEAEDADEKKK